MVWTEEFPNSQGWWWHWDGDVDSLPLPVSIAYDGTDRKFFVRGGQLGLDEWVSLEDFGGWWGTTKIVEPETPLTNAERLTAKMRKGKADRGGA